MGDFGTKYATQTGTSGGSATTTFSPQVQDAYNKLLGQIGNVSNTGNSNSTIQGAEGGLAGLAANTNGNYTSAAGSLGTAATPTYAGVANYMSPYNQSVIDATQRQFNLQNAQEQQGVIGNAIAKGAFGGNRVGVAQAQLAGQQQTAQAPVIAGLYNQNYQQALGAAQADKAANINAGSAYTGLGSAQSGTTQNALGSLLSGGQFDLSAIYNNLSSLSGSASALSGSGATTSSTGTTSESKPQGNLISQLLGGALGVASLFNDGGRVHAAGGGVMSAAPYFANDNYFAGGGVANDNYAPMREAALASAISAATPRDSGGDSGTFDPMSQFGDAMKTGASNIKNWLNPQSANPTGLSYGGVAGSMYARGGDVGRPGYAGGGALSKADIDALYSGILDPRGGIAGGASVPPPIKRTPTIDTTNTIDGDNLGLGLGNTSSEPPPVMAYADTPDDQGMNQPPTGLHAVGTSPAPSAGVAGGVPFTTGDQFMTTPQPGYSQNVGDAWKSLTAGKGLNLSPDMRQSLLAAGLGMMASKSPFALAGIGEGGLTGIEAWNARQKLEADLANQRASNATTGADIAVKAQQAALTGAEAGRTTQATAIDRWDFTPALSGMVIKDKVNPSGSFVIPYADLGGWAQKNGIDPAQLPAAPGAGAQATPTLGPDGVSMNVEPPANVRPSNMGFTAPEIVKGQTDTALGDARKAYTASQEAGVQLGLMKEAEKNLPADGFLSPGTWASQRAGFAKQANSLSQVLGLDPVFDPNAVSASEELHKLTTQFGFALSRTTGSDIASSVVNQAIGAVPSIENTPQGFGAVVSSIQAGLNRQKDYYQFLQKWADKTGGDITGADEYFNKMAPPSAYANAAILSAAIVPKTQAEIDKAPSGTLFNVNGKLMQKP